MPAVSSPAVFGFPFTRSKLQHLRRTILEENLSHVKVYVVTLISGLVSSVIGSACLSVASGTALSLLDSAYKIHNESLAGPSAALVNVAARTSGLFGVALSVFG